MDSIFDRTLFNCSWYVCENFFGNNKYIKFEDKLKPLKDYVQSVS